MDNAAQIQAETLEILGDQNTQAILDVATATGWSVIAFRSVASEEIEHQHVHRPYCYAISQRARVLELEARYLSI